MDKIERKTIQDIKDYVNSLDTTDNKVYQQNALLIMSCFTKAMELIEENSKLRSSSDADMMTKHEPIRYEVSHKIIDPDTGDSTYTSMAYTSTKENAILLVHCLQTLDEDPNIEYFYSKIQ